MGGPQPGEAGTDYRDVRVSVTRQPWSRDEVVAAGVDTIMLDNFRPDELRDGVALVAGRALVEASGGVNLDTVRAIAETGVDVISVGALTHSVRSLDLGLDVTVAG